MPKRPAKAGRRTGDSNTYRFFVEPTAIHGDRVMIDDRMLVHQLGSVLRLGEGQMITLLDGSGTSYSVRIEQIDKHTISGAVVERSVGTGEPKLDLTLYVALLRGERFEWMLQKGTELGVAAFVPVACEHSVVDEGVGAAKIERWQRIIREAAEQSRRVRLPELRPTLPFADACKTASEQGTTVVLWEAPSLPSLRSVIEAHQTTQPWAVFSGPEGGWSEQECALAAELGIPFVSLGPRTLRAETAPLVAATALLYAAGDLD